MTLQWSTLGCALVGVESNIITCSCNHTTSFTAFMQYKPVPLSLRQKIQVANLYYAEIAFGIFFFIISITVLVLLIVFRKTQPISSRIITPYIGMTALIVSSLILGVVQRSVLVDFLFSATSELWEKGLNAANIIGNITMIIINTLNLTAILSYLIQVISFQILKYMYDLLGKKGQLDQSNKKLQFIKTITSQKVFIGAVLSSVVVNVLYWTFWVILVRTYVISLDAFTYIVGISYVCVILFMSLMISLIAIFDTLATHVKEDTYSKQRAKKQSKYLSGISNNSSGGQTNLIEKSKESKEIFDNLKKGTIKFFLQDSPLYFRTEMLLFLLCFTFMIIQQILGLISNTYRNSELTYNTAIAFDVIRFIFEILYTCSYILVFGGFSLILLLKQKIQQRNNGKSSEQSSELENVLNDPYAYQLFEAFCENEFSTENLYLRDMLKENQHLISGNYFNELPQFMTLIYEIFIKNESVCEVNIPSSCKKTFVNVIQAVNSDLDLEKDSDLSKRIEECFQELTDQIEMNLQDTYSRYVFSPIFENYQQSEQFKSSITKQVHI